MIDFKEGLIRLNNGAIGFNSTPEEIAAWIQSNHVEKVAANNKEFTFYRLHLKLDEGMPVDVIIELGDGVLHGTSVRWATGPCARAGWEGASLDILRDEYKVLVRKISDLVQRPPDQKKPRRSLWRFAWGNLFVESEVLSFDVAIFMEPSAKL